MNKFFAFLSIGLGISGILSSASSQSDNVTVTVGFNQYMDLTVSTNALTVATNPTYDPSLGSITGWTGSSSFTVGYVDTYSSSSGYKSGTIKASFSDPGSTFLAANDTLTVDFTAFSSTKTGVTGSLVTLYGSSGAVTTPTTAVSGIADSSSGSSAVVVTFTTTKATRNGDTAPTGTLTLTLAAS